MFLFKPLEDRPCRAHIIAKGVLSGINVAFGKMATQVADEAQLALVIVVFLHFVRLLEYCDQGRPERLLLVQRGDPVLRRACVYFG